MTENEKMENRVQNRTCDLTYTYNCTDCGRPTTIKLGEILYAHDNSLRVTTRCKACRDAKNRRFAQI